MSIAYKLTYMKKSSGATIRQRRKELGLTQKEVGAAAGVSSVTVGFWEADKHKPTGEHLMRLARKLGLRPEAIVGEKAFRESELERQAEQVRLAFLHSSGDLQEAARRIFGIVEEIDKSGRGEK